MRFLHTSDWHLGRSLHRADLREAQAAFLDHLVDTARAERVDAVLVAGDVYDRAIAPVDSVALCEDALARLRATGARVILISGNHDSALRLGVNSALIDTAGVHLRTNRARLAEPVVLTDEHGPVAVYGVPYLEPALGLPAETPAEPMAAIPAPGPTADPGTGQEPPRQRGHATVLGQAAARIRADAAARGMNRTVLMAHAWVTAGSTDDERRDAADAAAEQLRAGHLGRRHRLRARRAVRRVQLRGPRPPARPADPGRAPALQRLAAALLLLREEP